MLKNNDNKRHERECMVVFSLFHGRRTRERLGRIKGQPRSGRRSAKGKKTTPPPNLEAQGADAAKKKTRQLGKARGRREEKPPAAGKSQGAATKKPPDSLERAAQGQGQGARAKPAKRTQTRADTKTEGGLSQPKTRAEKHTPKKKVVGLS